MKVSRTWLQKFFDAPLPDAQALSDALTFHAFEIDGIEKFGQDEVLDVKVTPNRGHDCLSHRGIAKELSAILDIPLAHDPLAQKPELSPATDAVSVTIAEPDLCYRYAAGYIKGVAVGPSPKWLKERLLAIGQRSINNVVDATNFVMFNTGQPLHAFDAKKLTTNDERYSIEVRKARAGEKMTALDNKEYALTDSVLVISDANADAAIGIAGVKGGIPAAITETTKDIIIESANFSGVSIRKTAAALKLRTDASVRFEQVLTPELAGYGMVSAVELIRKLAGGELVGYADVSPNPAVRTAAAVTLEKIRQVLGVSLDDGEVKDVFRRLGFAFDQRGSEYVVQSPFERLDLIIAEDLIEEVARIIGYDRIPAEPLPLDSARGKPPVNQNFYAAEQAREDLLSKGFSEVMTSVFADAGERAVANKIGGDKPYLRASLVPNLAEALERNKFSKDLLGFKEVKIFEIGTVWKDGKEATMVGTASESEGVSERALEPMAGESYGNLPFSTAQRYQSFSKYPYIVRDIAMWVPSTNDAQQVQQTIQEAAGPLLQRISLFDRFEKGDRVSLAYRLVFQSFEKTLEDAEANAAMEKVYEAVRAKGFEIR